MGRRHKTTLDGRPQFFNTDGTFPTAAWKKAYEFEFVNPEFGRHYYCPTPKGLDFHEATEPNVLIEGSRGTGKSILLRNDAHMRALAHPGHTYLIVRRTMPELKKSHLHFISHEMKIFGGFFHRTDYIAHYPNGSTGWFSHCEKDDDVLRLLSSEFCAIYFDEMSTFTWEMITKIAACARVKNVRSARHVSRCTRSPSSPGAPRPSGAAGTIARDHRGRQGRAGGGEGGSGPRRPSRRTDEDGGPGVVGVIDRESGGGGGPPGRRLGGQAEGRQEPAHGVRLRHRPEDPPWASAAVTHEHVEPEHALARVWAITYLTNPSHVTYAPV